MAPAAINKEIPPSIGIQGGGQHPGVGGWGGGAPAYTKSAQKQSIKNMTKSIFVFICLKNGKVILTLKMRLLS